MSINLKQSQKKNLFNSSNGFTLVEMAISMIIVGLVASSGFFAYTVYETKRNETRTLQVVSKATSALYEFKNANGRYPCPAPILETKDTSPNYGRETDCADPNIGTGSVVIPGQCLDGTTAPNNYNGICVERSTRTISGINPRVRVGAIPFRDLQIDEKDTFDGYGSRLVYAVTEDMAVAARYKDTIAAIEIQDGNGNILSSGNQSVSFVVISPGKNKNGSVSVAGNSQPCNAAATDLDAGNCRDFASAVNTQAIYVMDATSSGTNQFDDIVEYYVPIGAEVWRRENAASENIIDLSEDMVGVGITSPADLTADLTVKNSTMTNDASMATRRALAATNTLGGNNQSGGLRIGRFDGVSHSGKILADRYCTEDGTQCFTTDRIAGPYDNNPATGTSGMGCPVGQYMVGVEAGRAKCSPIRIFCPPGQVITGFGGSGDPICAVPTANCVSEFRNLCGTAFTVITAGNGVTRRINYVTGGACAYNDYRCDSGSWTDLGGYNSVAACSFVAATPPTSSTPGVACGAGFSGTYTQSFYLNCAGNQVNTTNTAATDCACVGITDNVYCGASFGGAFVGTKQRVCSGPAPGTLGASYTVFKDIANVNYPSEAALIAAKCSCSKTDFWEFANCPAGMVRKASPTPASFATPADSWPGGAGDARGQYRKRTVNASLCDWDSVSFDSSNCECSTGYNFRSQNPTCGSCDEVDVVGSVRQIRSGAGCGWIDDPDTSGNTVGTCRAKTFSWKNSGVSAGPSNPLAAGRGVSPICGTACLCGENGNLGTCAVSTIADWTYFSSNCQPN